MEQARRPTGDTAAAVPPVTGDSDPLTLLEAEIARDNAAFLVREAAGAAADGQIGWVLYFLDAADQYEPEPGPAAAGERIQLLSAMEQVTERTAGR